MSSDRDRSTKDEKYVPKLLVDIVRYSSEANQIVGDRMDFDFAKDRIAVLATERCVQIVTEAVIQLGQERMEQIAPEQPWNDIRHMGNMMRHEYERIEPDVIYNTVKEDLSKLSDACEAELKRRGVPFSELMKAKIAAPENGQDRDRDD